MANERKRGFFERFVLPVLGIPLLAIAAVAFFPALALWVLSGLILGLIVRLRWVPGGTAGIFVYSESPTWHAHIEQNLLPRIEGRLEVLNWSERRKWEGNPIRTPLAVWVFRRWKRHREFNPMAIVFVPWWRPRVIRFWKAFKDFKHGKPEKVMALENELVGLLRPGDRRQ